MLICYFSLVIDTNSKCQYTFLISLNHQSINLEKLKDQSYTKSFSYIKRAIIEILVILATLVC